MNDVGGSGSGTGLRAVKSSRTSDANFEYDDSEWDVGIGNLIIDLDADIEKNNEDSKSTKTGHSEGKVKTGSGGSSPVSSGATGSPKRTNSPETKIKSNKAKSASGSPISLSEGQTGQELSNQSSSSPPMHIPKSPTTATPGTNPSGGGGTVATLKSGKNSIITQSSPGSSTASSGGSAALSPLNAIGKSTLSSADLPKSSSNISMEHTSAVVDKGLKMKIKRSKPGTKSVEARHEIVKSDVAALAGASGVKNSVSQPGDSKPAKSKEVDGSAGNSASASNNKNDDGNLNSGSNNSSNSFGDSGAKNKGAKRGSTHKKIKSGTTTGSSSTNSNSSSSANKSCKESANSSDCKANAPATATPTSSASSATSNNSHVKDLNFGGSSVNMSVSAFAKNLSTGSSNSSLKLQTATTSIANSTSDALTLSSSVGLTNQTSSVDSSNNTSSSYRGAISPGTTATATTWAAGSPAKVEKGRVSPSVTTNDKPNTSLNQGLSAGIKKSIRPYGINERVVRDGTTATNFPIASGGNSSPYRTSVTLSSASLTDLSPSSVSSGGNVQGAPLSSLSASHLMANFAPAKDIPKAIKTVPPLSQDVCVGTSVGTVTEPDCLGPCEPGTSVTLEGIVWHETESGVLVVNVTWRGKTYVGTLLDCTKNDWAPPRFCDSPTSDLEMRTPKNRGKRGRAQASTPVNEAPPADTRQGNAKLRNGVKGRRGSSSNTAFATPVSPMKSDQWQKRKTRGSENEATEDSNTSGVKSSKRPKVAESTGTKSSNPPSVKERQSASPAPVGDNQSGPFSPALIECPEPNCSKKYKHINGLRYHQSHAHSTNFNQEDSDSNMSTASNNNSNAVDGDGRSLKSNDIDGFCDGGDMDVDMVSTTDGENTSSAPPTPAKRNSIAKESNDKIYDINSDVDLNKDDSSRPGKMRVLKVPLAVPNIGKVLNDKEKSDSSDKDSPKDGSLVTRVPILTVPMYVSNRTSGHSQENQDRERGRDSESRTTTEGSMKSSPSLNFSGSKTPTWQPHNHSHAISHSQPSANSPVALTVPVINTKDHDKNKLGKDKSDKKNKHKKKSKDKDRERERDVQKNGSNSTSASSVSAKPFSVVTPTDKPKDLSEKRSSSLDEDKESLKGGSSEVMIEPRDEPLSPAYSDISDANESGPETDKNIMTASDRSVKGDSVIGLPPGHGMSPFFPGFYPRSPSASASSKGDPGRTGLIEETSSMDSKSKHPLGHLSGHVLPPTSSMSPDERRSPKVDFPIGGKYIPPQHFYQAQHPPYFPGYYDYPPASAVMDSNYPPGRSMEDKDRDEGRLKGKLGDRIESPSLISNIKQEPGIEKEKHKEARLTSSADKEPHEIKTELPEHYEKRPVNLMPNQHFIPCSKHAKDARHERHSREELSKDSKSSSGRSSVDNSKSKDESDKDKEKHEGAKPTMQTQGPPPPPTAGSYAYIPQSYLPGSPFGFPMDPSIYRQLASSLGPYSGPYVHPSMPRYPPPGGTPLPEDLSRPSGPPPPGSAPKALDLLSHHAQYYAASHKIHELQERALKSPNPQVSAGQTSMGPNVSPLPASTSPGGVPERNRGSIVGGTSGSGSSNSSGSHSTGKAADLSKDTKPLGLGGQPPESRSPPTQHHVHSHTHHHTHVGIGYPIIPTVPPQYSPHYGVITTPAPPPSVAASVITPFPPQKPT